MIVSFVALCVLLAAGIPIGICLGMVGIAYFHFTGAPIEAAAYTMFNAVKSYTLISVPLYLMAGQIMNVSGVSNRLFDFASIIGGRLSALFVPRSYFRFVVPKRARNNRIWLAFRLLPPHILRKPLSKLIDHRRK